MVGFFRDKAYYILLYYYTRQRGHTIGLGFRELASIVGPDKAHKRELLQLTPCGDIASKGYVWVLVRLMSF